MFARFSVDDVGVADQSQHCAGKREFPATGVAELRTQTSGNNAILLGHAFNAVFECIEGKLNAFGPAVAFAFLLLQGDLPRVKTQLVEHARMSLASSFQVAANLFGALGAHEAIKRNFPIGLDNKSGQQWLESGAFLKREDCVGVA